MFCPMWFKLIPNSGVDINFSTYSSQLTDSLKIKTFYPILVFLEADKNYIYTQIHTTKRAPKQKQLAFYPIETFFFLILTLF